MKIMKNFVKLYQREETISKSPPGLQKYFALLEDSSLSIIYNIYIFYRHEIRLTVFQN